MARSRLREVALRGILRDVLILTGLLFSNMQPGRFTAGLVLFLLGCGLHFWSKGVLVRNWVVTTTGPYRLVRHPFYLANLIIDLGIGLISGNLYLLVAYVPGFLIAYLPTIRAEEASLREGYGEAYDRYAAEVPMLLPWRLHRLVARWAVGRRPVEGRGRLGEDQGFSWENIEREREIGRILRILAVPLYFTIAHLVLHTTPGEAWRGPALASSILLAVLLNVAGAAWTRSARRAFWRDLP